MKITNKINGSYVEESLNIANFGYPEDTQLIYDKGVSRWKGTGYRDSYYRIGNTGDALIIKHNNGTVHFDDLFCDTVHIVKGYYSEQKEYGRKMAEVAKILGVPFAIACIFNGDCEAIFNVIDKASSFKFNSPKEYEDTMHWLTCCGVDKRTSQITEIIGYCPSLGQRYNRALAGFIADHLRQPVFTEEYLKHLDLERKRRYYASFGIGYSCRE